MLTHAHKINTQVLKSDTPGKSLRAIFAVFRAAAAFPNIRRNREKMFGTMYIVYKGLP
ncbi:hypothetical protein DSBG_1557 [Desulfosporosinus sp. BG]|nr:hypothetical protein DSBG_1557 [Desulfosporosinus sp. BG]